jgi:hypothetical protein
MGRAFPNPKPDAIWKEIEITRTIVINEDDVRKLGKDPSIAVKLEDRYWELGEGKYAGQIGTRTGRA